ncbi:hypothetical protein HPP92_028249 [Vanilla planifolia]|uniref:Uncharacterized protein n=1 Tax=Vanilla planifolia TaxID=51239 RepID=A0A835P5Y7_VANPL|nr:hypothetical protein HPP92_028249 [Vanilla planifolia]
MMMLKKKAAPLKKMSIQMMLNQRRMARSSHQVLLIRQKVVKMLEKKEELSGEASKQESSTDEEMQIGGIESNAHDVLSEDEHVTSTVDNAAFTGSNVGDVTHTNGMVELEIDTAHEVEAKNSEWQSQQ